MDRITMAELPADPHTGTSPRASTTDPDSANLSRDTIAIKNLQIPFGVIAPDVWGKAKEQPALVSINLLLKGGFASASSKDELDESTIHYGILAKRVRSSCRDGQTAGDLSQIIETIITDMARKDSGRFAVAKSTVDVQLPKASMFGDGIALSLITTYDSTGKAVAAGRIFSLKGVKIMTLIGVNSYERTNTQPLIVDILLHLRPQAQTTDSNSTVALFNLEQTLVEIMKQTAFETLETLADFTVTQLRKKMLDAVLPGTKVQLRIEKPRAIAWADAPVVEIMRDVPYAKRSTRSGSSATALQSAPTSRDSRPSTSAADSISSGIERLSVVKPYNA
ncbi:hypothetical protein AC579_6637 [Pseudocercospora musae]|uniref:dihydroneopterin aldolase n=1 Tax=Pseudocercospora musae TaxID=113226 RepID=A0A139IPV8_9PEZI|nr:hypothetical protein AC579_6637 [Pseudocercospora musae]